MYTLNPLVDPTLVVIPKCDMYPLKNVHGTEAVNGGGGRRDDEFRRLKNIAARQEVLLDKLKALDVKLNEEAAARGLSFPCANDGASVNLCEILGASTIVLNADPIRPPFSLLALPKVWPSGVPVDVTFHVHSSVKTLPKSCLDFQSCWSTLSNARGSIDVRIVWKQGLDSDCELIVSPVRCVPILGEANLVRFLDRLLSLSSNDRVVMDDVFDACHALNNCRSSASVERCLGHIFRYASPRSWLVGNEPSAVDAVGWSAVTRSKCVGKLSPLGKEWFERCEKRFSR